MIGRTLGGTTVASLQGIIVFLISFLVGFRLVSAALLPVAILFIVLIGLLFTALGTIIASLLDDMQGFQLIMNFLVMPIFFLSGALFPLQGLPKGLVAVASVDPLSYGVDGLRGTLANGVHFGLTMDFLVLGAIAAILLVVGGYLFSKIQV
jgi:ABC-2 type transport system permease protein